MLFQPSHQTSSQLKRSAWIFLPLWISSAIYIWLVSEGVIPTRWNGLFFLIAFIWLAVYIAHALMAFASVANDLKRSQHPDSDVADLIDGRIDITTYRARKEESRSDAGLSSDAESSK